MTSVGIGALAPALALALPSLAAWAGASHFFVRRVLLKDFSLDAGGVRLAAALFALVLALSLFLLELILVELTLIRLLPTLTRLLLWRADLYALLISLLLVVPYVMSLLLVKALETRHGRPFLRLRSWQQHGLALVFSAAFLYAFWRLGKI